MSNRLIFFVAALMFGGIGCWSIWLAAYVANGFGALTLFALILSTVFFITATQVKP